MATDLVSCCSGVADTAEIGDRATRLLHREGVAKMRRLAGVTQAAGKVLAVDGATWTVRA